MRRLAAGLVAPTSVVVHAGRLLVTEQPGRVLAVDAFGSGSRETVLDIRDRVVPVDRGYDESGLLSVLPWGTDLLAFYTAPGEETRYVNRLSRFASDGTEIVLLEIPKDDPIHHGGRLARLSGMLWVSVGDGGPQKDPHNRAQDMGTLQGKILYFSVGSRRLHLAPGGKFRDAQGVSPVYALGVRNPWGMWFDRAGRLFVADVGYDTQESLYIVQNGDNLGWSLREGTAVTPWARQRTQGPGVMRRPVWTFAHREGQSEEGLPGGAEAIIGGASPRPGVVVVGNLSGAIYVLREVAVGVWRRQTTLRLPPGIFIRSVGQRGERVLVLTSRSMGLSDDGELLEVEVTV